MLIFEPPVRCNICRYPGLFQQYDRMIVGGKCKMLSFEPWVGCNICRHHGSFDQYDRMIVGLELLNVSAVVPQTQHAPHQDGLNMKHTNENRKSLY